MKYGYDKNESHSLAEIAYITGYRLAGLKTIYEKGLGAFFSNRSAVRPQVNNPQQWASARVYSAIMGGKAYNIDKSHLIKR
jgi:hypothetical protein